MFNILCTVVMDLIDKTAGDEDKGWIPAEPGKPPSYYYWPSQCGTLVAVSIIVCSVLLNFKMFKCFNFDRSLCPIYLIQ